MNQRHEAHGKKLYPAYAGFALVDLNEHLGVARLA